MVGHFPREPATPSPKARLPVLLSHAPQEKYQDQPRMALAHRKCPGRCVPWLSICYRGFSSKLKLFPGLPGPRTPLNKKSSGISDNTPALYSHNWRLHGQRPGVEAWLGEPRVLDLSTPPPVGRLMRDQRIEPKAAPPPFLLFGTSLLQLLRCPHHSLDKSLGVEGIAGKQTAHAGCLLLGSNLRGSEDQ